NVARTSSSSNSDVPGLALKSSSIRATAASWSASVRMGLIAMLNLRYVDLVVLGMGPEELDKNDLCRVIDCYDEPVSVALDIENHSLVTNDARSPIVTPNVFGSTPLRGFGFL